MTKEQAKIEYIQIMQESAQKRKAIATKAKKDGTWLPGLDSNNALFEDVDAEMNKRIEELKKQIDE